MPKLDGINKFRTKRNIIHIEKLFNKRFLMSEAGLNQKG